MKNAIKTLAHVAFNIICFLAALVVVSTGFLFWVKLTAGQQSAALLITALVCAGITARAAFW